MRGKKSTKTNKTRGKGAKASLYPTPNTNGNRGSYRPTSVVVADTPSVVTAYDRRDQIGQARELFSSMPDLGGAVISKANWCVGNGFSPVYTGENKEWGEIVEKWLESSFYPLCNTLGQNFDFRTTLHLSSMALDVDGATGLLFTTTRSGFPQVQLIPAHRIGCVKNETVVEEGRYAGYQIQDGIILNASGRPIAYRILISDKEYVDVSANDMQYLYEPEWGDQLHGISRIARPNLDFRDIQDMDIYTKLGLKISKTVGLIHFTEDGAPDRGALVGLSEDTEGIPSDVEAGKRIANEYIRGGMVYYAKANSGEKFDLIQDSRPHANSENFISRIQRRALYSIGWSIELLDPSKLNGGAVRLIQDLARKSISSRQNTLERRARLMVVFAIAKAMKAGIIPQNDVDWYSWAFTKGSQIQVDLGNEEQAQREAYKLGTTTLSKIASSHGMDWVELRKQQYRETFDLLTNAKTLSKEFGISLQSALNLLSQRTPNSPVDIEGGTNTTDPEVDQEENNTSNDPEDESEDEETANE